MLGKLIKHEFRSTARNILLLIIALAVITPLTAVYIRAYNAHFFSDRVFVFEMFRIMSVALYVFTVIACVAATYIILLFRFYKSMISREAYLTHTLPVNKSSLLISKIVVAVVWQLVTIALAILSVGLFTNILGMWHFGDLQKAIHTTLLYLRKADINVFNVLLWILVVIADTATKFSTIFASFSVGQRMGRHPILGTVISYFAYSTAVQFVVAIGTSVLVALSNVGAFDWIENLSVTAALNLLALAVLLGEAVLFAITYTVAVMMFKKKLNV